MPPTRLAALLAALLVLAAATVGAGAVLAQEMTLPPSEEGRYVYDLAEIWTPDTEAQAQAICGATADHKAAVSAFLNKQRPVYEGR